MEFNEGLAKLEGRARIATIVLWVFVAIGVLTAGCELLEAAGMIDIETGSGILVLVAGLVYFAYTAAFIGSVVVVAMWIHRAHANLHDTGVDGLDFTPGWAVGWYFIPFANLIKPFQAMRELWTASHGENNQYAGETPSEVKTWWAAWIIGNILSTVSTRILLMGEGGASSVTVGNAIGVAGTTVIVLAAVLLTKVMQGITQAQRGGSTAVGVFA